MPIVRNTARRLTPSGSSRSSLSLVTFPPCLSSRAGPVGRPPGPQAGRP
jgi:hypothetical protein